MTTLAVTIIVVVQAMFIVSFALLVGFVFGVNLHQQDN